MRFKSISIKAMLILLASLSATISEARTLACAFRDRTEGYNFSVGYSKMKVYCDGPDQSSTPFQNHEYAVEFEGGGPAVKLAFAEITMLFCSNEHPEGLYRGGKAELGLAIAGIGYGVFVNRTGYCQLMIPPFTFSVLGGVVFGNLTIRKLSEKGTK